MRVMMSLQTAELVLFDEENAELLFSGYSPAHDCMVNWAIGVEDKAHVFDILEDLGSL